jgi:hypothetical protein
LYIQDVKNILKNRKIKFKKKKQIGKTTKLEMPFFSITTECSEKPVTLWNT